MTVTLSEYAHSFANSLPRFSHKFASADVPTNGIYLFFEVGESTVAEGRIVDRIVRVGTHRKELRFPARLRDHFGGNRRASVFRRHLGGALLRREDPHDPRLISWTRPKVTLQPEVEARVSALLRERFTFCCIRVDAMSDRLELERGLIALLAQYPPAPPSPAWLGHFAVHPTVRSTGLWNTRETDATPLDEAQLQRLIATTG